MHFLLFILFFLYTFVHAYPAGQISAAGPSTQVAKLQYQYYSAGSVIYAKAGFIKEIESGKSSFRKEEIQFIVLRCQNPSRTPFAKKDPKYIGFILTARLNPPLVLIDQVAPTFFATLKAQEFYQKLQEKPKYIYPRQVAVREGNLAKEFQAQQGQMIVSQEELDLILEKSKTNMRSNHISTFMKNELNQPKQ